jgi:hypothetical protein
MKVGDLVTLSASGKKVQRAAWVHHDDFGIVIRVTNPTFWKLYEVKWNKSVYTPSWRHDRRLDRRDLKHLRHSP